MVRALVSSRRDDAGRAPAPRSDPSIHAIFLAAALSLNGFGGAGGISKAIADWVTTGDSELDVSAYRAWRFGRVHRYPTFAAEQARETYRYYRRRHPFDQEEWERPGASRCCTAGSRSSATRSALV